MSLQLVVGFSLSCFAGVLMLKYGQATRVFERPDTRCRTCGGILHRNCTCDRG